MVLQILLIEDGQASREMAEINLDQAGCQVCVARDRQEALYMLQEKAFDLVLMDILMPQANGLETTRVIRQNEMTKDRRLPIIGLTETNTREQREACLAAGMDACMPKPLAPDNLYTVIAPLISTVHADRGDGDVVNWVESLDPASNAPVDLREALRGVDGDIELLQDVIALFLGECPDHLSDLGEALAEQDTHSVERAAYRLKGILGNVGARVALSLAEQLEIMGENRRLDAWEDVWVELKLEITNVIRFLKLLNWTQATEQTKGGCVASLDNASMDSEVTV